MQTIAIHPIGRVKNRVHRIQREGWESVRSEIIIDPEYGDALDGIEEYSHLYVLFWIGHTARRLRGVRKIHPRSREDLPLVGVFATRTQYRPNPIGLTMVELLGRERNVLKVQGLDALDGTPVIDLKPISPRTEVLRKPRVPRWYHRLWEKRGRA